MRRILVIGSPGAGKTTLSRRIAEALGLPLVHLDREYWRPGWVKPAEDVWDRQAATLAERSAWVMDGEYFDSANRLIDRATAVVWLDLPPWLCLPRALRRLALNYRRERVDLAPGCPEYFNWDYVTFIRDIWTYPSRTRPGILARLDGLRPDQERIVLRTPRAVQAFADGLPSILAEAA
ncbi:AAA family ATPase [Microvirga thermotolerans]|uniref:AAA family ATPase n=1 Tax=Microvirga thermotolerans TaxID=2651334 RepID=A0A5P9JYG6_9HYPH|nr:AAA family ATPase [Microvirga thermotolerans]QFU16450.1 AAA family ATPase [Microvirga thermotolerans]